MLLSEEEVGMGVVGGERGIGDGSRGRVGAGGWESELIFFTRIFVHII